MPNCDPNDKDNWWPCACVRRDRKGNMKDIKLHHPDTTKCDVCKAKRPRIMPTEKAVKP